MIARCCSWHGVSDRALRRKLDLRYSTSRLRIVPAQPPMTFFRCVRRRQTANTSSGEPVQAAVADIESNAALLPAADVQRAIMELRQRVDDLEFLAPAIVRVAHYNILASYLGKNTQPWFLYGALTGSQADRERAALIEKRFTEVGTDGKHVYAGWPNYVRGILTEKEIAEVERIDSEFFAWEKRKPMLVSAITRLRADIVSLVELDQYDEFFSGEFDRLGYDSAWFKRPRQSSKDGCGVLWRRSRFDFVAKHGFFYNDDVRGSKDRAALMVLLRLRNDRNNSMLLFCSTHLARNPECSGKQRAIRLRQAAQLFRELNAFAVKQNCLNSVPVMIGGDWNTTSMEEVRTVCAALLMLQQKRSSAHPLLWACGEVPTPSTSVTAARDMRIDHLLFQESMLQLLTVDAPSRLQPGALIPDEKHPSDHLPVCATFQFKTDLVVMRESAVMYVRCLLGLTSVLRRALFDQELKCAFRYFDANDDGLVETEEFSSAIRTLGEAVTAEQVEILQEACFDGETNAITFQSFKAAFEHAFSQLRCSSEFVQGVRSAFDYFDSDGSGTLTLEEVRGVLTSISPFPIDDLMIEQMMEVADSNGDGCVDLREFADFCHHCPTESVSAAILKRSSLSL
mmetsp:Transcript_65883/g.157498  ORF Transcript_65883/g.157498 Transcript_65883/m.157498 type:complete len:625 (-) Transcript_65883:46-1920(-)